MDASAWDERYAGTELVWGLTPNRFLVEETEGMKPGRALDAACGEGRNTLWLASRGWDATGVDFSRAGIERGKKLAVDAGVSASWLVADVTTWEPPHLSFDLVVIAYLQLPMPVRRTTYARLAAAVAPGGTFLVIGHDRDNLSNGVGGPQNLAVLLDAVEVSGDVPDLVIDTAEKRRRPVEVDGEEREAIDTVVRAHRPE